MAAGSRPRGIHGQTDGRTGRQAHRDSVAAVPSCKFVLLVSWQMKSLIRKLKGGAETAAGLRGVGLSGLLTSRKSSFIRLSIKSTQSRSRLTPKSEIPKPRGKASDSGGVDRVESIKAESRAPFFPEIVIVRPQKAPRRRARFDN